MERECPICNYLNEPLGPLGTACIIGVVNVVSCTVFRSVTMRPVTNLQLNGGKHDID